MKKLVLLLILLGIFLTETVSAQAHHKVKISEINFSKYSDFGHEVGGKTFYRMRLEILGKENISFYYFENVPLGDCSTFWEKVKEGDTVSGVFYQETNSQLLEIEIRGREMILRNIFYKDVYSSENKVKTPY